MADTARMTIALVSGDKRVSTGITYEGDNVQHLTPSIADASTNYEILIGIDISKLQAFVMVSDVALTVKTNNGTTPIDTFTLTAAKPVMYRTGDTAIFTADVTALYITNASGSAAAFELIYLVDA